MAAATINQVVTLKLPLISSIKIKHSKPTKELVCKILKSKPSFNLKYSEDWEQIIILVTNIFRI
jgi:hypothetical protein